MVANFNSPIGAVSLGVPSGAERDALSVNTPFHRFGRPGLAASLANARQQALSDIIGSIDRGNDLRAILEAQSTQAGSLKDVLQFVVGEGIKSGRIADVQNLAATIGATGAIPFSGPLTREAEELAAEGSRAGIESERALAAERAANAGLLFNDQENVSLSDPLGSFQQDVANSLPVQRAAAGNPGLIEKTTQTGVVTRPGERPIIEKRERTVKGSPGESAPSIDQGISQRRGVEIQNDPGQSDPVASAFIESVIDKVIERGDDPTQIAMNYTIDEQGRKLITIRDKADLSSSPLVFQIAEDGSITDVSNEFGS